MFMTPFYPNPQVLGTKSCLPSFHSLTPSSSSPESITGDRRFPCKMEMQSRSFPVGDERDSRPKKRLVIPQEEMMKSTPELAFSKLQPETMNGECRYFGEFVARQALLDEEYWTAAWLRAESHWEDRPNDRYAESYKRQFAEQEFNAVKRKCKGYAGQKTDCIVAVKKEDKKVKRTIIKSVVGTLDLSIKSLFQGESFPGEKVQAPLLCNIQRKETSKYGYIANLCVAKSARRKGIAINMLTFAIESAKSNGAETIFVHVHRKNIPAQQLYQRLGFEIVDEASQNLDHEQMYLLSIKA